MRAFSLIELMVVIAIVALLSVVAVPAYNQYVTKAKISSAIGVISSAITKSKENYNIDGEFGQAASTGFAADGSDPTLTDYTSGKLTDTLAYLIVTRSTPTPGICNFQTINAYITNFGEGDAFLNPPGDAIVAQYSLIDVNGTVIIRCSSAYSVGADISDPQNPSGGTQIGGEIISNCPNVQDDPGYFAETANIESTACQ